MEFQLLSFYGTFEWWKPDPGLVPVGSVPKANLQPGLKKEWIWSFALGLFLMDHSVFSLPL